MFKTHQFKEFIYSLCMIISKSIVELNSKIQGFVKYCLVIEFATCKMQVECQSQKKCFTKLLEPTLIE